MREEPKSRIELKVSGMTCATCAETVKKALESVPGVDEATVNVGTEHAVVKAESGALSSRALEDAVRDAGYGIIHESVTLLIGGMTCAMCVKAIENALNNLDGVVLVRVNLASEKAYVTYNPGMVGVREMKEAILRAGYQYLGEEGKDSLADEQKARQDDLKNKLHRTLIGFAVSFFLMAIMLLRPPLPLSMPLFMFLVSTLPFAYLAYPIVNMAVRALRNHTLNMDVMYSMGIGVAYVSSVFGTFGFILTPDFLFYETAIMLAAFLTLGRYLEARAKARTSDSIRALMRLQPGTATVVRENAEVEVAVDDITEGDVIRVHPGERIAADGKITSEVGFVDESMVTGESVPVRKKEGDQVIGGTLSVNSSFLFIASHVGADTVLAQIIQMVGEAQGTKPQVQRIADTAVSFFIPVVLIIALAAFMLWYIVAGAPLLFCLTVLISILVVACPCALGLATPTAVTVGVGRGAELGILIRNGEVLETSGKISHILFDKTGTLTEGNFQLTDLESFGMGDTGFLSLAAGIERYSEHPVADAVLRAATEKGVDPAEVSSFSSESGRGVLGMYNGQEILLGNRRMMEEHDISLPSGSVDTLKKWEGQGKTVAVLALNNTIGGFFAVSDTMKKEAPDAVRELKKMGMSVGLITGDNEKTASAIASEAGIDHVMANILPGEKAEEVSRIQAEGAVVGFIGDGINDAPALAQADVGIAIGSGTDVAIETGDLVLMHNNLIDAVGAIQLSRKVMQRIRMNLFWAFAYNSALIPVAAGLLYPFFGIQFMPEYAGLAMALSSATVVSLSLLLRTYTPPALISRRKADLA